MGQRVMSKPFAIASILPNPPGFLGISTSEPISMPRPLLGMRATCGFPSPAEDHMVDELDLSKLCITNPNATIFVEADSGASMIDFGIFPGDKLIIDRSINAKHGDIAMVLWDGGYMIKKLSIRGSRVQLISGNPDNPPILVHPEAEFSVIGVVTWSFKKQFRR